MLMVSLPSLPQKYKAVVLAGVTVLVVGAFSIAQGGRGWAQLRQLEEKQQELEVLAFRLEQRNQRLREHLRRIEQDDAYLEKLARERLGWIKPGEIVFRVRRTVTARGHTADAQIEDAPSWAVESPGGPDLADP
ncbi:MAG: hypothetical protein A3J75_02165 [Acidobacteria bacterium RBG_16_68_9]|nr:MAG: hypothetical protein A3J75_02165 [Acidobacteria bacterium RBG_16_68_9]